MRVKRDVLHNSPGTMGIIRQTGRCKVTSLCTQHLEEHLQVLSSDGTYTFLINVCCGPLTLDPRSIFCLLEGDLLPPSVPLHFSPWTLLGAQMFLGVFPAQWLFSSGKPMALYPATEGWSQLVPLQPRLLHSPAQEGLRGPAPLN